MLFCSYLLGFTGVDFLWVSFAEGFGFSGSCGSRFEVEAFLEWFEDFTANRFSFLSFASFSWLRRLLLSSWIPSFANLVRSWPFWIMLSASGLFLKFSALSFSDLSLKLIYISLRPLRLYPPGGLNSFFAIDFDLL